jgi:hypothetical protein
VQEKDLTQHGLSRKSTPVDQASTGAQSNTDDNSNFYKKSKMNIVRGFRFRAMSMLMRTDRREIRFFLHHSRERFSESSLVDILHQKPNQPPPRK